MSEITDRLDAIDARLAKAAPGAITITPSDVAFLMDLAREQQAIINRYEEEDAVAFVARMCGTTT